MEELTASKENIGQTDPFLDIPRSCRTRIASNLLRSMAALFRKQKNVYKLFFSITKKLHKLFSISTAVLVVRSTRDGHLKVIAIKRPTYSREGLALTLPEKDSLFYSVLRNPAIYTENFSPGFDGNFIERKLMLDDRTKSLAICPIITNGVVAGLVCFTSPAVYAFQSFQEGFLDPVLKQFGAVLGEEERRLNL